MLSENPIVVSDIGGLNEIVQHKENGMKTYCGNPNSIADAILELLYDHKLCAEITKKQKIKLETNTIGTKFHKTHTLHIKKQFVNQWQKNKKENLNKKEQRKQKKQKIQKKKSQTYWISRKDMHMHKKFGWDNLSQPDFFNF